MKGEGWQTLVKAKTKARTKRKRKKEKRHRQQCCLHHGDSSALHLILAYLIRWFWSL
ncbi:unnamed protein product [Musa banksii]